MAAQAFVEFLLFECGESGENEPVTALSGRASGFATAAFRASGSAGLGSGHAQTLTLDVRGMVKIPRVSPETCPDTQKPGRHTTGLRNTQD